MTKEAIFLSKRESLQNKETINPQLIHGNFFKNAEEKPDNVCVYFSDGTEYSYGYIAKKARQLAKKINDICFDENEKIAVVLNRGALQIIAVMAVLYSGHTYVPIGTHHPEDRRNKIIEKAGIKCIISETSLDIKFKNVILADRIDENYEELYRDINKTDVNSLAYIIFTSGSTGTPKGVAISHKAAWNTIYDINKRFEVNENDCAITVSALDFDLSVYDIFGLTSVCGKLLIIDDSISKEAAQWSELTAKYNVTIWNSVPALFEMYLVSKEKNISEKGIRLALISGDWIPMTLPELARSIYPDIRFISLGGATECSIWSNYFEVKKDWEKSISNSEGEWSSVPYGMPLTNQKFRVCDETGKDCEDNIAGELWIGGDGVAEGYYNDPQLTDKSFITDNGERWYKTGDYGCFHKSGIIEFLGRKDNQVKVSGFRIELGEIDSATQSIKGIEKSYSVVKKTGNSLHILTALTSKTPVSDKRIAEEKIISENTVNEEHQTEIIEKIMTDIVENTEFSKSNESIKYLWLKWLESRNIFTSDGNKGGRYRIVTEYKGDDLDEEEKIFMEKAESSKKLLSEVLSGDKSTLSILDDDFLSPEKMSYKDKSVQLAVEKLIQIIRNDYQKNNKVVNIAFVDGRTGSTVGRIIEKMSYKESDITYIENSMAILTQAREILNKTDIPINYEFVSDYSVNNELIFKFDYVISVNGLHRYKDTEKALKKCRLLLKNGGKLVFIEQEKLMPVGYITAAVIENGFENLDEDRKSKGDPMLASDLWKNILFRLGYSSLKLTKIENSMTFMMEATFLTDNERLTDKEVKEKVSEIVPDYMIPEYVKYFYDIPLSSNGKIDRKKIAQDFSIEKELTEDDMMKTQTEETVSAIWSEILGLNSISRNSGFIEIGGDSLAATKFLTIIKNRMGVDISLQQMFENQTLYKIAELIEQKVEESDMEEGEI